MLKKRIENSALLKATLAGVQRTVRTTLGIDRFVLSVNNNPKQGIRSLFGSTDYPYGWAKFPTISLDAETAMLKGIARRGSGWGTGKIDSSATVKINHYFPAKLTMDCYVKFQQYDDVLVFAQLLLIASAGDLLNFKISLPTEEIHVKTKVEGNSLTVPQIDDLEEGSTPGTYEFQFALAIDTKIGFSRDIAKINNEGTIQINTELDIA